MARIDDAIKGPSSRSVHAGEERPRPEGSLTVPIYQTATFTFEKCQEIIDYQEGLLIREEYGRYGNPTLREMHAKIAFLEGGEEALSFASGMCAITTTLLSFLDQRSHLVATYQGYPKTNQFCEDMLGKMGVPYTFIDMCDYEDLEAAMRPETKIVYTESPTNPFLRVWDLEQLVEIAHRHGALVVIDSTFASPLNLRPLDFGVDLVIHSVTKYLAGHNDLLGGVVVGGADHIFRIKEVMGYLGGILAPHDAYLLLRGLKTLGLRIPRHNENGEKVAEFLDGHPKVRRVWYPSLAHHPDHDLAHKQMSGFGGVVSFEIDGDRKRTSAFVDALRVPYIGPSLGGVETLADHMYIQTYYHYPPEKLEALGITKNLVRLACGIEDAEDLIADLGQALDAI